MTLVGIMQGRLSPPVDGRLQAFPADTWRDEFPRAATAGLDFIEWIYDGEASPIDAAPLDVRRVSTESGVAVASVCADIFMRDPLVGSDRAEQLLPGLLERAAAVGARHVVLPFVDDSSLRGRAISAAAEIVNRAAASSPVDLHLELDLPPDELAHFLGRLPSERVRVTWDIGNGASLGYDPGDELEAMRGRLGSVHVKDRVSGGPTVPLGSGAADFERCFRLLNEIGFDGPYVLQAAREDGIDETELAVRNRQFVESQLKLVA